jgi:hypothetical protein
MWNIFIYGVSVLSFITLFELVILVSYSLYCFIGDDIKDNKRREKK